MLITNENVLSFFYRQKCLWFIYVAITSKVVVQSFFTLSMSCILEGHNFSGKKKIIFNMIRGARLETYTCLSLTRLLLCVLYFDGFFFSSPPSILTFFTEINKWIECCRCPCNEQNISGNLLSSLACSQSTTVK